MTCPVCNSEKLWGPAEIAEAGRLGIPVFESEVDLLQWRHG